MSDFWQERERSTVPLEKDMQGPSLISKVIARLREDGIGVVCERLAAMPLLSIRSWLIGSRLRTQDFRIGRSPKIRGLAHIQIGRSFSGGDYIWIEALTRYGGESYSPQITIGNNVTISDHVHIGATAEVHIEEGVLIGSRVTLIDHNHGIYDGRGQSSPFVAPADRSLSTHRSVRVGKSAWIGDGVVVLPGAVIGEGSVIGANSVVLGSIPPYSIAVGSPARAIRTYNSQDEEWVPCKTNL